MISTLLYVEQQRTTILRFKLHSQMLSRLRSAWRWWWHGMRHCTVPIYVDETGDFQHLGQWLVLCLAELLHLASGNNHLAAYLSIYRW